MAEVKYTALRNLMIPNGPGVLPSTTWVDIGEIFSLDGDEPIDIEALIRQGSVSLYKPKRKVKGNG
jgi:hypothetical protein